MISCATSCSIAGQKLHGSLMAHSTPHSPHSDPVCDPCVCQHQNAHIQISRWPLQSGPWCYLLITTCHPSTGKPLRKKGVTDKPVSVSTGRDEIMWLFSWNENQTFPVKRICHLSMSNIRVGDMTSNLYHSILFLFVFYGDGIISWYYKKKRIRHLKHDSTFLLVFTTSFQTLGNVRIIS